MSDQLYSNDERAEVYRCGKLDQRIDADLIITISVAVEELRVCLSVPFTYAPTENEAAMQAWTRYLGVLLIRTANAVVCLAMHHESIMAMVVQRQAAEYIAKLLYLDANTEIANQEWRRSSKLRLAILEEEGRKDTDEYREAKKIFDESLDKYPAIANSGPSVKHMIDSISGGTEAYAAHYRYPTSLLHGDPLGYGIMFKHTTDGSADVAMELEPGHTNQILTDLCHFIIQAGEIADRRLGRADAEPWNRLREALTRLIARLEEQ